MGSEMCIRDRDNSIKNQKGNAVVAVLVLVAIAAVGGLAFFSGKLASTSNAIESSSKTVQSQQVAATSAPAASAETPEAAANQVEIIPGNPTVATIDGEEIKRLDVFQIIQTLPPQARQQPIDKLFPIALDQVVNAQVIEKNVANVNLDKDPEVKKQLLSLIHI